MSTGHILVIGAASIDTKGRAGKTIQTGTSTPGAIRVSVGGVGRNIAENLANLGERVILLSAVGGDGSGRRILQQAAECGIDTSNVLVDADHRTAAYLAVLDDSGDLVMSIDDMSISRELITPGYIYKRRALFRDARMLVLDASLSAQTFDTILKLARRYSVPVCADPTTATLALRLCPYLLELTLVAPNAAEAKALCDVEVTDRESALVAAQKLVAMGVKIAIVTLGATGLVYATWDESGHVPAIEVEVVELTGAGDALTAAVVFGLLNDFPRGRSCTPGHVGRCPHRAQPQNRVYGPEPGPALRPVGHLDAHVGHHRRSKAIEVKQPLRLSKEVQQALESNRPLVALESTVIAHGLPYPANLVVARRMETIVRQYGAVPATIAVLGGQLCVGLKDRELQHLATARPGRIRKTSRRDLPVVVARGGDGATTVAATVTIAHWAGIEVFATGGIGGVHRNAPFDVSNDLPTLASVPVAVVCAGAKSILDLRATLEWLETGGVPVIGYGANDFPAFYTRRSGLPVDVRVDTPREAAAIIRASRQMGLSSGLLIAVPVPAQSELPAEQLDAVIDTALAAAEAQEIEGSAVTPFLLSRVAQETGGASLSANVALLENNAAVAARIAVALKGTPPDPHTAEGRSAQ